MAANKRPRKKYSPKRNPLAACRYAHFIPKLAVSNEPLKDREVAETIDTIGKRYTERGKFIATGDELRLLQQTADRFKAALEMAAWKHYVRAIKESEPILDAEAHRKRKKQEG